MHGFFDVSFGDVWRSYSGLRKKYSDYIPIPNRDYFKPIASIEDFADLIVRPIHCPLWLGVNAVLFFLKSLLSLAATLLLIIPALVFNICAPKSQLSNSINSAFTLVAFHTVVAATMSVIAACATLVSLLFNPIYLITRGISTVVKGLDDVTDSCCHFHIAKF